MVQVFSVALQEAQIRWLAQAAEEAGKPIAIFAGELLADARRLDAELVQAVDGADGIELQRAVVVGGERLAGHEVEGEGLEACERVGQRHHHAFQPELPCRQAHEVAERHHVGAVEFVDLPDRRPRVQGATHGFDDVADVHRREARAGLRQRLHGA